MYIYLYIGKGCGESIRKYVGLRPNDSLSEIFRLREQNVRTSGVINGTD